VSKIKKLAGETVLYGFGNILPKFLNFLLLPIHTRFFAPDEYGVVGYLLGYVTFINVIFSFGMETAFFRYATAPGADPRKIFNLAQTIVVSISLFFSVLFIVYQVPISKALHIEGHPEYIVWLTVVMFLDAIVAIPFAQLRLEKKPLRFASAKIANVVIMIGLNYYFLYMAYHPAVGVGYVFLANMWANIFYLIFFAGILIQWRPLFDKTFSRIMLYYAYPIMLTGLAGMTNDTFSRITLEWWLPKNFYPGESSAHALGVFVACYKFAVLMSLAVYSFRLAAEPFFFSNASDRNSPALFARVNHYFIMVCCALLVGVSLNLDLLKYVIPSSYWEGFTVVPVIMLGYLFLGMYYNFSVWFKLTDRTFYSTLITVGGATITVVMNFLLIPIWGYMGSSWAAFITYFSMAMTCYLLGQKYYPIPYRLSTDCGYILVSFLVASLIPYVDLGNQWLNTGFHAGVFLIWGLTIYGFERISPPATPETIVPKQ
jgi:O-antigen/teichoic acid export membrane protein